MVSPKFHMHVRRYVHLLQGFADRPWYAPLIAFLSALDNFIVVIPNDGILISSAMLKPKQWFYLAVLMAIGSTLGAVLLAFLVAFHGLPWMLEFFPDLNQTATWLWTDKFFDKYGLLLVFGVALTPLMQQPTVIMAGLADTPLFELGLVVFVGRLIKFLIMAYAASHAPRLLSKMWGVRSELEDAGINIK